ncbi:MAG: hypothetical protein WC966_04835 [Bradymonadales bacterium]|jgi:hypothetical protein
MIPDYLIIDEIRRRRERAWEPEPLHLPLYVPDAYPEPHREDRPEPTPSNGVIIIDMNNYERIY